MKFNYWIFIFLGFASFMSCVDQEFDIPPGRDVQTEDISNTTIAELKANFAIGASSSYTIPEETVIKGIVVSSDEAGNFFKTLVIQDETAGIHLSINAFDLFVDYAPGRTVYVQGGLELGEYNGLPQLGIKGSGSEVERIPEALLSQYLVIGETATLPEPTVKTINSLSSADLSTLIKIEEVEYTASLLGGTYAIPNGGGTQNRIVEDCSGNELILRNSDFASFAGASIPDGNGSVIGVYSVFGTTDQFTISDLSDVDFTDARCDGSIGGGGPDGDRVSVADVRAAFASGNTTAPDGFIQGIVISDVNSGNLVDQNLVLQDGESGIVVRFTDTHTFELGSEVKVSTTGLILEEFNGLLQLNNAQLGSASFEGGGNIVAPKELTISEIMDDFENLESTLVRIKNAEISGGNVFSDFDVLVSDGTDDIGMFTRSSSNFGGDALPTGSVEITAIVSQFNDPQIVLRNRADVSGGSTGTGGGSIDLPYTENFNSGLPSGWQSLNTTGDRAWSVNDFDDIYYATMSAYDGGPILDVVTWLITPEIDFDAQSGETMELIIADAFENGNPLKAYYSTDYSGSGSPTGSTWVEVGAAVIPGLINNSGTYDNVYESTGLMDLSAVTGSGYVAFVYDSAGGSISTTVQISDVIIK